MENLGISKEKLIKIKNGIIFGLLFLWMVMPIFQTIRVIYKIIDLKKRFDDFMNYIIFIKIVLTKLMFL